MIFGKAAANLPTGDLHPFSSTPFFLLSGMGRSGTTVLRNCVASHPQIHCRNMESNYVFHLFRNAHLYLDDEFSVANLAVTRNQFWQQHQQLTLNLLFPQSKLPADPTPAIATYSSLDPRAALGFSEAFLQTSICYIVRNGIEVVSSYRSFKNFEHLSFEHVCRIWRAQFSMIQYVRDHANGELIRYEWLLNDRDQLANGFDSALKKIGLEFDSQMLEALNKKFHPTRFAGESKTDAKDPQTRKDRWKLWTNEEREIFATICGDAMSDVGYDIPWA